MSLTLLTILSITGVSTLVAGILEIQKTNKHNQKAIFATMKQLITKTDALYLSIENTFRSISMTLLFILVSAIRKSASYSSKSLIKLASIIERHNVPKAY